MTDYSYSPLDLVRAINYNGAKQAAFQYNKAGELVRMEDWTGVNTFELDLLGQLKKATDHKGNVTEYTYDEVGNQTSVKYPDGGVVQNTYDEVYNLTKVKDPDQGVYTYIYDAANRAVEQIYPNGWIEENTYDPEGNLLKVMDTDPFPVVKKTVKKFEYKYDAEGNLIWEYKRDSDGIDGLVSCADYTYDALNQLTGSARATQGYPNSDQKRAYEYDSLGNLVRETRPENGQKTTLTYQYNNLNQMVHKQDCSYISSITRLYDYGYTYDKRGNLVKEEEICAPTTQGPRNITIATYRYDETNKMVSGTNADGEYSNYTYNGLGVRVGTELILNDNTHGYTDFHCQTPSVETGLEGPHGPEVVLSDYVIDYTRLNIDQRVLMEHEVDGYDFRYVYGLDLVNVKVTGEGSDWWGQNIKQCIFSDYVHTDRLGSVVNLSDQYGRVPARIDYDAWGSVTAYDSITVDGGFRILLPEITYAGHQYDDILNQYYAKARMYDADSRRFTGPDPILDPSQNTLTRYIVKQSQIVEYLYVENNALRYTDPLGKIKNVRLNNMARQVASSRLVDSGNPGALNNYTLEILLTSGPWSGFHKIAQVLLFDAMWKSGKFIQSGTLGISLEYSLLDENGKSFYADAAGFSNRSPSFAFFYEVKPGWHLLSPNKLKEAKEQLSKYVKLACEQRTGIPQQYAIDGGPQLNTVGKEITIYEDSKMRLTMTLSQSGSIIGYTLNGYTKMLNGEKQAKNISIENAYKNMRPIVKQYSEGLETDLNKLLMQQLGQVVTGIYVSSAVVIVGGTIVLSGVGEVAIAQSIALSNNTAAVVADAKAATIAAEAAGVAVTAEASAQIIDTATQNVNILIAALGDGTYISIAVEFLNSLAASIK